VFVLGLLLALFASPTLSHAEPAKPPSTESAPREIEIIVQGAYKPSRIEVHEGERVRLKFVRKDYGSCTREVVFPQLDIRRELPTNKPVLIDLPALAPGEYTFQCGMSMIKGTLVVLPKR
jgi:plastocyanin domain-containing protein